MGEETLFTQSLTVRRMDGRRLEEGERAGGKSQEKQEEDAFCQLHLGQELALPKKPKYIAVLYGP